MKHFVHIYHVMRSKFEVEAFDPITAITAADILFGSHAAPLESESAEEITSYLVDIEGDEDHDNSRWFEADGVSPLCSTFYVHCEHADFADTNYDLIIRAADEADALVLWHEHYGDGLDDEEIEEPVAMRLEVPVGRGVVPW